MSDTNFIKLADGTIVFKDGRVESPHSVAELKREEAALVDEELNTAILEIPATKKLSDLPESPRTMNGISAVLGYSLFGLDDDEIATAIGTTPDRVAKLKLLPSFTTMRAALVVNVLGAEQADVRELFVKHARLAVRTVVDGMGAKKVSDRLRAAGDILDRGGFRPADVVEHRHRLEGGLTIEIVRKDLSTPLIDIDITED